MTRTSRVRLTVVGIYFAIAVMTWISFVRTAHDGLANIGLVAVALPYTLIGLLITWLLGAGDFVLIPHGAGYLVGHALFFVPGVALTALLIWWITGLMRRRF